MKVTLLKANTYSILAVDKEYNIFERLSTSKKLLLLDSPKKLIFRRDAHIKPFNDKILAIQYKDKFVFNSYILFKGKKKYIEGIISNLKEIQSCTDFKIETEYGNILKFNNYTDFLNGSKQV